MHAIAIMQYTLHATIKHESHPRICRMIPACLILLGGAWQCWRSMKNGGCHNKSSPKLCNSDYYYVMLSRVQITFPPSWPNNMESMNIGEYPYNFTNFYSFQPSMKKDSGQRKMLTMHNGASSKKIKIDIFFKYLVEVNSTGVVWCDWPMMVK